MSENIIKFDAGSDVNGYGFDLIADRVVRFNKHPDGTYLNTRVTYSINKKQFTHFDLRKLALQKQEATAAKPSASKGKKWLKYVLIAAVLLIVMKACTVNFSVDINSDSTVATDKE